jgi:hypothetical protein
MEEMEKKIKESKDAIFHVLDYFVYSKNAVGVAMVLKESQKLPSELYNRMALHFDQLKNWAELEKELEETPPF